MNRSEWARWTGQRQELPVTCDPSWAQAVESAYSEKDAYFKARAWLVAYNWGEALVVGYESGSRALPHLTLSPFGLYCGVAPGDAGGAPDYEQVLELFESKYLLRYRSLNYSLPFYAPESVHQFITRPHLTQSKTHVLDLDVPYETLFTARFKGATRTCLRRAERDGVRVSVSREAGHVRGYYEMHRVLAERKGGYGDLHPEALFTQLLARNGKCELAVAFVNEQLVSGGIFLDDGPSTFYWHAATDRNYVSSQPNYALLSLMIQRSIARGKKFFNFGGSAGIESLEKFKESWGATARFYYGGSSVNPLLRQMKKLIRPAKGNS